MSEPGIEGIRRIFSRYEVNCTFDPDQRSFIVSLADAQHIALLVQRAQSLQEMETGCPECGAIFIPHDSDCTRGLSPRMSKFTRRTI